MHFAIMYKFHQQQFYIKFIVFCSLFSSSPKKLCSQCLPKATNTTTTASLEEKQFRCMTVFNAMSYPYLII